MSEGFFLLLNGSGAKDGERAVISVPVISLTLSSHICVGFWYHMLGPSVATLDLLVETVCNLISTTTHPLSLILHALFSRCNDMPLSRIPLKS